MYFQIINDKTVMLPIYPVTTGFNVKQRHMDRPEGHIYSHIFTVTDGHGIVKCNGEIYPVKKGDMFYLGVGVPHEYYKTDENFKTAFVTYDGKACKELLEYYSMKGFYLKYSTPAEFIKRLKELYRLMGDRAKETLISSKLYELLHISFEYFTSENDVSDEKMVKVKNYINQNFFRDLSLDELSEVSGLSKYTFCRNFKTEFHESPFTYVLKVRISAAKELLYSDKKINVDKVAEKCGFHDTSYFCRIFRKFEGVSPNKFRADILK